MQKIAKINLKDAPIGDRGQRILTQGEDMGMRYWYKQPDVEKSQHVNEYETLGFAIEGRARIVVDDSERLLEPGDSWQVPAGKPHHYEILEPFAAVEVTSPSTVS